MARRGIRRRKAIRQQASAVVDRYANTAGSTAPPKMETGAMRERNCDTVLDKEADLLHRFESVLLIYPEEAHGIRKFPAAIDDAPRVVAWIQDHISAEVPKLATL
jgi:hypothetical protein